MTRGVAADFFDPTHRVFVVPYSSLFTLALWQGDKSLWAGVFAFDLLRRPNQRWSPVQEASRFMSDVIRPVNGVGQYMNGGVFIPALLQMVAPDAEEVLRKQNELLRDIHRPDWRTEFDACRARHRAMEYDEFFLSRIAEFSPSSPEQVLARPPAEFWIYSTFTLGHDYHDYMGCVRSLRMRVVSRAETPHRLILDLRPQYSGFVPPDEELACWLCAYLGRRQARPGSSRRTNLSTAWSAAIWTQLTGKTESEHKLDAWASGSPDDAPLSIILGRETATGLRVPSIEATYASVSDVIAIGERVRLKTKMDRGSSPSIPVDVELGCSSAAAARSLVAGIARREFRRLGRSKLVQTIVAYYGEPWNSATLTGGSPATDERVVQEFGKRHASRAVSTRRSGGRLFLFAS